VPAIRDGSAWRGIKERGWKRRWARVGAGVEGRGASKVSTLAKKRDELKEETAVGIRAARQRRGRWPAAVRVTWTIGPLGRD